MVSESTVHRCGQCGAHGYLIWHLTLRGECPRPVEEE